MARSKAKSLTSSALLPPPEAIDGNVKCAELIALLYLLHSVPRLPSSNKAEVLSNCPTSYTLTFEREKRLTSTLAFLSYIGDDSDHIPAVCIREQPSGSGLSVYVAVNKVSHTDGTAQLQCLQQGFDEVFATLTTAGNADLDPDLEAVIMNKIVTLCSQRILGRLRLVTKRGKASKPSIKAILQQALIGVQNIKATKLRSTQLQTVAKSFVEKARGVIKAVDAWVKHQIPPRLIEVVDQLHCLSQIYNLQALLNTITNYDMNPCSRKSLWNIIGKVARYREAAKVLHRMAMRCPPVRQMKVVPVILPQQAFEKPSINGYEPDLTSTLARLSKVDGRKWHLPRIAQLLQIKGSALSIGFSQQTRKTLQDAKVHAEVQLILFCDLDKSAPPPRIICSSKDACFLCNAFLHMHGKIQTPRSHGRLYPAWRLPRLPTLPDLQSMFATSLQIEVQKSLAVLLQTQRKTVYPDPNESTLFSILGSFSTVKSLRMLDRIGNSNSAEIIKVSVSHRRTSQTVSKISTTASSADDIGDSPESGSLCASHESLNDVTRKVDQLMTEVVNIQEEDTQTSPEDSVESLERSLLMPTQDDNSESHLLDTTEGSQQVGDFLPITEDNVPDGIWRDSQVSPSSSATKSTSQTNVSKEGETFDYDCAQDPKVVGGAREPSSRVSNDTQPCTTLQWTPESQVLPITIMNGGSRRLVLGNLEVFLEVEAPATISCSVSACSPGLLPDALQIVDALSLKPEHELLVKASGHDKISKFGLSVQNNGIQHVWEVRWIVVSPNIGVQEDFVT